MAVVVQCCYKLLQAADLFLPKFEINNDVSKNMRVVKVKRFNNGINHFVAIMKGLYLYYDLCFYDWPLHFKSSLMRLQNKPKVFQL